MRKPNILNTNLKPETSLLPEEELISQLRNGNALVFKEIYDRYSQKLLAFAIQKTNSSQLGKEIIQDLFANLWERKENLEIQNLEAYLFSAAKYKIIYEIKKALKTRNFDYEYVDSFTSQPANDALSLDDLKNSLESALEKLPQKTKEIFIKSRKEEKTHKEISLELNISEKSVEYHITQSLKLLKVELIEFLPFLFIAIKISE